MRFRDFKGEKEKWITFMEGDFYPNYMDEAREKYIPILERFEDLLEMAESSEKLFLIIQEERVKERIQLLRIFRRFVSPDTSVEMLKVKKNSNKIIEEFGHKFRSIDEVRHRFRIKDDILVALLREYDDRGTKGYDTSSAFFGWFDENFGDDFEIIGPIRAGKDIYLDEIFKGYPSSRPVDFIIKYKGNPLVVGFVRYDSDRGGAQEDDRPGGYTSVIYEILDYAKRSGTNLKVLFVNEGPGLTLGSMWEDYSTLEDIKPEQIKVVTLKMLGSRISKSWLLS